MLFYFSVTRPNQITSTTVYVYYDAHQFISSYHCNINIEISSVHLAYSYCNCSALNVFEWTVMLVLGLSFLLPPYPAIWEDYYQFNLYESSKEIQFWRYLQKHFDRARLAVFETSHELNTSLYLSKTQTSRWYWSWLGNQTNIFP